MFLAQGAPVVTLDWLHVVLVFVTAFLVRFGPPLLGAIEEKLRASGHAQAAEALDVFVKAVCDLHGSEAAKAAIDEAKAAAPHLEDKFEAAARKVTP